jgi:hypothetical protein
MRLPPETKLLTAYRKHWAHRFGISPFLPMSRPEMEARGWDECDVILVTGDAYIDHPSFGMALIGRLLEAQGFRVGILSQPDWHSAEPFRALGKPALFFGVTAGNMDSMVNRYTADRKIRSDDAYTPDAEPGKRPDRAVVGVRPALPRGLSRRAGGDRQHRGLPAPHRPLRLLVGHGAPLGAGGFQGRPAAVRQRRARHRRTRPPPGQGRADPRDPRPARQRLHGGARLAAGEDWTEVDSTEVDTPGAVQAHPDPYAPLPSPLPASGERGPSSSPLPLAGEGPGERAKVSPPDTASVPLRFVKTEARRAARAHTVIRLPPTSR